MITSPHTHEVDNNHVLVRLPSSLLIEMAQLGLVRNGQSVAEAITRLLEAAKAHAGRIHRQDGGSTIQDGGLAPYLAQTPQVNVPRMQFPTLNFGQVQSPAQQQQAQQQQNQQYAQLGSALGQTNWSGANNWLGNQVFGSTPATSAGGWQTSTQPSGGFTGGLGDWLGISVS